jgi:DNA-binding response OmpR family regulator
MKANRRRVLVIEDDEYSRDAVVYLLKSEGYEIQAVGSGKSGVSGARTFHPDVILLDLGLPDVDGTQVIKHIRRDEELKKTPIIVMTGQNIEEARYAVSLGANDFLLKPIEFDRLLNTIPSLS